MLNSKRVKATTVVDETIVAYERRKYSEREKRKLLSVCIGHLPEKKVAQSADNCSLQAVRLWKAEERTISSHQLLDLAHDYDSVWKYVCIATGRAEALKRVDHEFYAQQIEFLQAQINQLKEHRK